MNDAAGYLNEAALPECDEECKKKCEESADENIRKLANPVTNITWNCKNNYHVYTTDYDPDNSHFDRIASDVMDVQRIMNKITELETKKKTKGWSWTLDERETDTATLNSLKDEMGIPREASGKDLEAINVREAIESAAKEHAKPEASPGYIKAAGLDNSL